MKARISVPMWKCRMIRRLASREAKLRRPQWISLCRAPLRLGQCGEIARRSFTIRKKTKIGPRTMLKNQRRDQERVAAQQRRLGVLVDRQAAVERQRQPRIGIARDRSAPGSKIARAHARDLLDLQRIEPRGHFRGAHDARGDRRRRAAPVPASPRTPRCASCRSRRDRAGSAPPCRAGRAGSAPGGPIRPP